MMFKNLTIYRIGAGSVPELDAMETALQAGQFAPCGPTQDKAVGWVPPRGNMHDAFVESIGGQRIINLRIETKTVPGAMVRKKAQEAADQIEATTGRKPGKKEMRELRDDALLALLPQAFPKTASVLVWIDQDAGLLMTDANSQAKADEVVTALVRALPSLQLSPLNTQITPQTFMSGLLVSDELEGHKDGFYVERACVLKSVDEEKATVKYNRHTLVIEEVRQHIAQGKCPTELAMSWEGRIAFTLTDSFQLRKLAFLEGVFDDRADDEQDQFDADVAITTGELKQMLPKLIAAMGGELSAFQLAQENPTC